MHAEPRGMRRGWGRRPGRCWVLPGRGLRAPRRARAGRSVPCWVGTVVDSPPASGTLFTVGHSTRPLDEFMALLHAHGIGRVVDVRRFPGSRRHPHFGKDNLAAALADAGVEYAHEQELGGRREAPAVDAARSPNVAWRNASFRAYADHTASAPFRAALEGVLEGALARPTAVMCAEAVPWSCHRQVGPCRRSQWECPSPMIPSRGLRIKPGDRFSPGRGSPLRPPRRSPGGPPPLGIPAAGGSRPVA
ncbi:MAG: DUF488 domain-containing protein [Gemmatimonadetes bacterium]|nr:DUF488 domain-containing protein [Gemmatimonadota bacterium]